jgi:threonyl-tRNA synthetase
MAMAVQRLRKDAQVTIGPWIERGFYYDFDMKEPLVDKDLKAIKKEMAKIIRADLPFIREEVGSGRAAARLSCTPLLRLRRRRPNLGAVATGAHGAPPWHPAAGPATPPPPLPSAAQLSAEAARARISEAGEPYKLEILDSILARDPAAAITIYHIGEKDHPQHWWDLCAGPHVPSTGAINADAIELESVAGEAAGAAAAPAPRCCRGHCSHTVWALLLPRPSVAAARPRSSCRVPGGAYPAACRLRCLLAR